MKVFVAEKPSVARELAFVLGATKRQQGYIEGKGVAVTWGFGHLVTEMMPEDYNPEWKRWDKSHLPIIPDKFALKASEATIDQFRIVAGLLKHASEIVCATDAGREGELIFRNIYELAGATAPLKRLWVSSLTEEALNKGLADLRPGSEFDNLANAARCRSMADWIVGLNATRGYTTEYETKQPLTVGRVQTAVLKLIVDRRLEIEEFRVTPFWEVVAIYRNTTFKSVRERFTDKGIAAAWVASLGNRLQVVKVDAKKTNEKAPLPFDLTELQRTMNKRHHWSADQTLSVLQELYEAKLLTYPRTDSRYLSTDLVGEVTRLLERLVINTESLKSFSVNASHRIFNDAKVSDHHAIIPTSNLPAGLDPNRQLLYDTVVARTVAAFATDCIKEVTEVTGDVSGEAFRTKGTVIVSLGWRSFENEEGGTDNPIPCFEAGESGECQVLAKEGKTTPPKDFTEGTLLTAMETAGRALTDEDMRDEMKDKGLGTPATRAATIEGLIKRQYIERAKAILLPTGKGKALILAIGDSPIGSVELTGEWEYKLRRIERGELSSAAFMAEVESYTRSLLAMIRSPTGEQRAAIEKNTEAAKECLGKCLGCGKDVFESPKAYSCGDRSCGVILWKEISRKKISSTVAKAFLKDARSGKISGFKSKAGKSFDAFLVYNAAEKRVAFEFLNDAKRK